MKKTIIITLIVGIVINVLVNLLVTEETLESLLFLYTYFPITFLGVGHVFKYAKVKDWPWIATVVTLPVYLGLISVLFSETHPDVFWNLLCRTPLISMLGSAIILEYYIYTRFPKK